MATIQIFSLLEVKMELLSSMISATLVSYSFQFPCETLKFDMIHILNLPKITDTEVSRISNQDGGPVVSLAAVPAGTWLPNGGILSCRLNRLRIYERSSNSEFREHPLSIEGPFTALNYDHKSRHMLVTTRPTSQNPHVQHQLYEVCVKKRLFIEGLLCEKAEA